MKKVLVHFIKENKCLIRVLELSLLHFPSRKKHEDKLYVLYFVEKYIIWKKYRRLVRNALTIYKNMQFFGKELQIKGSQSRIQNLCQSPCLVTCLSSSGPFLGLVLPWENIDCSALADWNIGKKKKLNQSKSCQKAE